MKKLFGLLLLGLLWSSPSAAASRFAVCTATCTWDGSSTAMWSTTSGGATGASVPGTSDAVTLDANTCVGGVTCTITVNTNITIQSLTMGACTASTTGCILDFSANNNNITLSATTAPFSGSGTGTRTLNMGNGTWTLSGAGSSTMWTMATTTNLTFNANNSTLVFSGGSTQLISFSSGGLAYYNLTLGANLGGYNFVSALLNVTHNFTANGGTNIYFLNGVTHTINTPIFTGGGASGLITMQSASSTVVATFSSAASPTMSGMAFRNMTFTGGGTFSATNSFNLGVNTGISISSPTFSGSSAPQTIIGG